MVGELQCTAILATNHYQDAVGGAIRMRWGVHRGEIHRGPTCDLVGDWQLRDR